MYHEIKIKTSSTFVQSTVIFFNETKRSATKFFRTWKKVKNNSNSLSKFYWLSSSALLNRYILINFCTISAYMLFLMLDHTKWYAEKIRSIDAERAEHVHKLDVKLQSLCVSGFSLLAVRMLVKPYHFGENLPTTLCENKDGVHLFTLNFKFYNRCNKLLLCNSENGDVAWCNVSNTEWGFCVFLNNKNLFRFTTPKNGLKKQKAEVCWFTSKKKKRVFSTLILMNK